MDTDELLDLITDVASDVLERIGDDPEARYQFFKRFVKLAKEVIGKDRPQTVRCGVPRIWWTPDSILLAPEVSPDVHTIERQPRSCDL